MRTCLFAAAAAIGAAAAAPAWTQGVATEEQIASIVIEADRAPLADAPHPSATRTAEELRTQNLVNPEDALKYLPSTTIRKRYIGDRNALIGGRSFSTLQAPRGLVLVDGYLISNFLGRFDAPRWNVVAPEEIARVDTLYGPFSALHPGNSIGTTVLITTRVPEVFQSSVRITGHSQRFAEYGVDEDYTGYQVSAFLGGRLTQRFWATLSATRQDSTGHPMQYYTVSANAQGQFPTAEGAAVRASGARFDIDPRGRRRVVLGASSGAIDQSVQNQAKLRLGADMTEALSAEAFIAWWRNDTHHSNLSFLRDERGNVVWSGRVHVDDLVLDIPAPAEPFDFSAPNAAASPFAPSTRDERHVQRGVTLRTRREQGWSASLVYSDYAIREDVTRQAFAPEPIAMHGGVGTYSTRDGTGWSTLELQALYAPGLNGRHTLAVGLHRNEYELRNPVYLVPDWRGSAGVLDQNISGRTRLLAVYAQDRWQLARQWSATLGVRHEEWRAFGGGQFFRGLPDLAYPAREIRATSPKLSLSYEPGASWTLRASFGRGIRFPTVVELFQGTRTATSIQVNDPDLRPERSDALDLTAEWRFARAHVRASLFQDDVRNTIWNQTNTSIVPNVTNVQNVSRVRTRGVETAWQWNDAWVPGLSLSGNLAWTDSEILANRYAPSVGREWPRIPRVRVSLLASWRPTPAWLASVGVRHSGRMYNELDNGDWNSDVFGGVSRLTVADVRVAHTLPRGVEIALGVDNVTDERYYQFHPYPGRTGFAELRWSLGE